ncbi:CHRD domain-containing protein [Roseateles sp.]|uniref:CHRD domain-containing protein n=1 Tax=Roseateles sp. TaxID=1971397 RepID=UPI003BA9D4F0
MQRFALASLTAAALTAALPAHAHETVYQALLLGTSEIPTAVTPGTGLATVTMDFDLLTLRVQVTFAGLIGTTTASHIHCCTVTPGAANVGVATQTPSFTGFPTGVTSGIYDHTFDMSLASSYNAAFITANGGTVGSAFNALAAGLDSGNAYLNVHTTAFPGGEIRALLTPVPEPETYALMLSGLGVLAFAARRRRGH